MSDLIHLTDQNFEEIVKNSDVPVLVDFSASWCGPCKMLTPIVESLATDLAGRAKVCKIDIDESPNTSQKMGVRGVPTVIAFKNGEKTGSLVGLTTKEKLRALVE
jgi:thioredoxin 1